MIVSGYWLQRMMQKPCQNNKFKNKSLSTDTYVCFSTEQANAHLFYAQHVFNNCTLQLYSDQFLITLLVFSTLEIHFLFFKNEIREGTYPPCGVLGWKQHASTIKSIFW
jgi:hypothetical protein